MGLYKMNNRNVRLSFTAQASASTFTNTSMFEKQCDEDGKLASLWVLETMAVLSTLLGSASSTRREFRVIQ